MSRRLMDMHRVPDDEAAAVRDLLNANGIDWYEIAPNRWGISSGSIWVRDDVEFPAAKALLDRFQDDRRDQARQRWAEERQAGQGGLFATLRADPQRTWLTLLCVVLALALVVLPVWLMGRA